MKNVLIPNPGELKAKEEIFKKDRAEKIHVLVDFDRTLTKDYINGRYVSSSIAILRNIFQDLLVFLFLELVAF